MGIFNNIKGGRPKKSSFNLSHERKQSMKMGGLYPCYLDEVLPGDNFKVSSEVLMRFAPMISPIMHRVDVFVHYFFVPNRIVWDNWKTFITGGEDGLQSPPFPTILIQEGWKEYFYKGRLGDYMGIPAIKTGATMGADTSISSLPFRAYLEIYNEYFRDQNLEEAIPYSKGDTVSGADVIELTQIRQRAWEKDYFTSALPWAQRGGDVSVPVQYLDRVAVTGEDQSFDDGIYNLESQPDGTSPTGASLVGDDGAGSSDHALLQNVEGIDINDLRQSSRLQEWLEKNARGGSRYIEQILSHFGVKSSDSRLQRPEYLSGSKVPVTVSEVLQTSQTNTDQGPAIDPSQQGNMSGHGISVGSSNGFKRRFEEHGYVMGIMSVLPRTAYQDGIHRTFRKFDKLEYGWPEFANLGEQEIPNVELSWDYEQGGTNSALFGYTPRYSEYKFGKSIVCGDMRDTLAHWHMGRTLDPSTPLNDDFVKSDPRTDIFAVDDGSDHLYCQIYNDVKAIRPLPYWGTPRL